MDTNKENYIIVEIIPTTRSRYTGDIAQISALKLNGLTLIDRFDYRLNPDKINIPDICRITSYDKEAFNYLETTNEILDKFIKWSDNYTVLILDNDYTNEYLSDIPNKKTSICEVLGIEYSDNLIDILIQKYNLTPSNYIVDLLYESIISLEKK